MSAMTRLDPARCLRSAATALRVRRLQQAAFTTITRPDYRANALRGIAMSEEDARAFIRACILSGRARAST